MQTETKVKSGSRFTSKADFVPPLENGDRLTRDEFMRRYEAMPNVKAELIKGIVYMSSPVRVKNHGKPHSKINGILFFYATNTNGIEIADNVTLNLDEDVNVQPDVVMWIDENCGGNAFVTNEDYLQGSPELLVEIAASTKSYDLYDKFDAYRSNGVKEYVVWRVLDEEIDWFALDENGKYVSLEQDESGIVESKVFKGLRLNIKALLDNDLQQVMNDLQNGIASKEHAIFVNSLNENRKTV